jgi:hypothetical protein
MDKLMTDKREYKKVSYRDLLFVFLKLTCLGEFRKKIAFIDYLFLIKNKKNNNNNNNNTNHSLCVLYGVKHSILKTDSKHAKISYLLIASLYNQCK